ncbi:hypothetical protein [Daejeonia sp. YH14]|uniref:hypothetical protein n=1 Tax=Daejeonia sp. YH14 TaxID=3439042 RepID=UPI003F495051
MKNLLFILILFISSFYKDCITISNTQKKHLDIKILNDSNKDLFIKDQFNYDYYFYQHEEKVDLNKLGANKFYVLVEYVDKKPILKFFSISNENLNYNDNFENDNGKILKNNEIFNFTLPLEQYKESSIYKNYFYGGTRFFNYIEFPIKSKYKIKVYYKNQNNCESKVFLSNIIVLET